MDNVAPTQKLLFVCGQNKLRSLTAEKLFEGLSSLSGPFSGNAAGCAHCDYRGHIGRADLIFFMERSHLNRVRRKFPEALQGKRVVTLHIPDDYDFMQPELLDELRGKLGPNVLLPDDTGAG